MLKGNEVYRKVYTGYDLDDDFYDDIYKIAISNKPEESGKFVVTVITIYQKYTIYLDLLPERKYYNVYLQDSYDPKYEKRLFNTEEILNRSPHLQEFIEGFFVDTEGD